MSLRDTITAVDFIRRIIERKPSIDILANKSLPITRPFNRKTFARARAYRYETNRVTIDVIRPAILAIFCHFFGYQSGRLKRHSN